MTEESFNRLKTYIKDHLDLKKHRDKYTAVLCFAMSFVVLWGFSYTNAQSIYVNGEYVGTVHKEKDIVSKVENQLENELYTDVEINDEIEVKEVKANNTESTQVVLDKIKDSTSCIVSAGVIYVDGKEVLSLISYERAEKALNTIINKYIDKDMEVTNKGFTQRVEIKTKNRSLDETTSYNKAINYLEKILTVEIREERIYNTSIPMETIVTETHEEFIGFEDVSVKGQEGEKAVLSIITSQNGKGISEEVLQEKILTEKIDRQIIVGTSKVPPKKGDKFIMPTNGNISSYFGARDGGTHKGIDILNSKGAEVYASASGVVTYSQFNNGGFGNLVIIDHGNGFESYYAHNTANNVVVGQRVEQGDVIAFIGSTGDSTANHCHFEIRYNGTAYNPMEYIGEKVD